jgi:hypothetical protein
MTLTPYMPVPETNGEEWDRMEPSSALDVLVELALHGEYNGLDSEKRIKDGLELRAAAAGVFEVRLLVSNQGMMRMTTSGRQNFVRRDEIKLAIVQSMLPLENSGKSVFSSYHTKCSIHLLQVLLLLR